MKFAPLALYIHWPFCKKKCPYCDFNSHVRAALEPQRFINALLLELRFWQEKLAANGALPRRLSSVFFGGGTPSLMPASGVAQLLDAANAAWPMLDDCEITLEANPTSVEAAALRGFRAAGVNRVSIGVQSLDDAALKFLGREHNALEAERALAQAQEIFPRVSFDLIYAYAGHQLDDWQDTLRRALSFGTEHLSLYQLTLEPNTGFYERAAKGELLVVDEEGAADFFSLTHQICAAAGLPAYEVSNHARVGAESRHNLTYWRYGEYVGIGPGAHGRVRLAEAGVGPTAASAAAAAISADAEISAENSAQKYAPGAHGRVKLAEAVVGPTAAITVDAEISAENSAQKYAPGAHGRVRLADVGLLALEGTRYATQNIRTPEAWAQKLEENAAPGNLEILSADTQQIEAFMMGLRLAEGIDFIAWQDRFGVPLMQLLDERTVNFYVDEGLLERSAHKLRVSERGQLLLTRLTGALLKN